MDTLTIKNDTLTAIFHELDRDPAIKSKHTKRCYRADLQEFETWRAGREFNKTLVGEFAAHLQDQGKAPSTINRKLAAVRWMARRMADLAHEDHSMTKAQRQSVVVQAERAAGVADVRGDRHVTIGRHIPMGEIQRIIEVCQADNTPAGARDAAIFSILRAAGLRRAELTNLAMADVSRIEGEELAFDLLIQGKGDKTRVVPVNDGAALALAAWFVVRGPEPGPVFCAIRKGGKIETGHAMSGDALRQLCNSRADAAKVPHMTPHDWRRTFAGDLLDSNIDIKTVADLMGHESTSTTMRYDRRGDDRKRRAIRGLFVPYVVKNE